jgi:hypothetical protein
MKNLTKITLFILLINLIFLSCEEDSNNANKENYLKIDEEKYNLSTGLLVDGGPYRDAMEDYKYEGFGFVLTLVSSGIDYQGDKIFAGEGQVIELDLFSSIEGKLSEGSYVYEDTKPYPKETYSRGVVISPWSFDINSVEEEENYEYEVIELRGDVEVQRNDDEYTININCKDSEGKTIKAHYSGSLNYHKDY